jgi:F0F1-type ATP synthase assembly protein I
MYWPLIGGFIAFILLAVFLGWLMDPSRHGDAGPDGH